MKIDLFLIRAARKKGGDRYEATIEGEDTPLVVYFPQWISRKKGAPFDKISVEIKGGSK